MADNNLPPLQDNDTEETVRNANERTRTNPRAPQEDTEQNIKHKTEMLQQAPIPPAPSTRPNPRRQAPPSGYAPRPARRQSQSPKDSAFYLPCWSIVVMLIGVLVVSFGIVGAVLFSGGASNAVPAQTTPIIMIVTADPNALNSGAGQQAIQQAPSTEIINGQNAPANLQLSGPTLAPVQLSPTPAAIRIGSVVIVDGVDANTLNVRSIPNLAESTILFRAEEGEIFNVIDGPQQSSGFTWWQIQDPSDINRVGWAVSNFLTVQSP